MYHPSSGTIPNSRQVQVSATWDISRTDQFWLVHWVSINCHSITLSILGAVKLNNFRVVAIHYQLYILSDCYMGLDQQYAIPSRETSKKPTKERICPLGIPIPRTICTDRGKPGRNIHSDTKTSGLLCSLTKAHLNQKDYKCENCNYISGGSILACPLGIPIPWTICTGRGNQEEIFVRMLVLEDCSICRERYDSISEIAYLPCGHAFHHHCTLLSDPKPRKT